MDKKVSEVLESYVRNAPKGHELYKRDIEARGYACREYGGKCSEWLVKEARMTINHVIVSNGTLGERSTDGQRRTFRFGKAVTSGEPR